MFLGKTKTVPEENIYFQSYILRDFKEQCLQE